MHQWLCVPFNAKKGSNNSNFKKDDILDPLNYRPISITTPFSKIPKFGFRSKVSAQDAILYFIETTQHEIEIGNIVHAVLLDLSKTFDSLSHQILLKKLESLHFSPSATQIVESFLTGRLQQNSVNGVLSEWIELKQGVPQGTVVGPLFFNLYVNDLPELISRPAHILQYADDCLVFSSDKKTETALEILQDNIYKLEEYLCLNRLNLNGSKTEFITFSLKNDKRLNDSKTVTVGSTLVKKSDHCKYLGVTIDKHLGFQTQVKVLKNMAVGIKTVETVQHRCPTGVLLMLFHALVMSHLEYSLLFFFKVSFSLLLSLE